MISLLSIDSSPEVNAAFITAIVSAIVSILLTFITGFGSVFGFFENKRQFKFELENQLKLQNEKIRNDTDLKILEIKNQYSAKLLEKRIEIYPELIKITQEIGKDSIEDKVQIRRVHENAFNDIKNWQEKYGGTLFMQKDTYKAFQDLKTTLKMNNLKAEFILDKAKISSIWLNRNKLRNFLKKELNILHLSENDLEEELT